MVHHSARLSAASACGKRYAAAAGCFGPRRGPAHGAPKRRICESAANTGRPESAEEVATAEVIRCGFLLGVHAVPDAARRQRGTVFNSPSVSIEFFSLHWPLMSHVACKVLARLSNLFASR